MISEVVREAADVSATHRDEIVLPSLYVEHCSLHRSVVGLDLSVLLFSWVGEHVVGDLQQGLFLSRRIVEASLLRCAKVNQLPLLFR
jgi:hypothetical protein